MTKPFETQIAASAQAAANVPKPIQDRRLSLSDAEVLVANTRASAELPLQLNAGVLAQLNLLLGTPDDRKFLHAGVGRMRDYETAVRRELSRQSLPAELLAVLLVESGYQNQAQRSERVVGAGLWMFIPPTARHYGLHVSTERDERLNVDAETNAATKMLADLRERFNDWPLALMAYSAGAAQVERGIDATGLRDAWELSSAGFGNDRNYVSRVIAVSLIAANPTLLH